MGRQRAAGVLRSTRYVLAWLAAGLVLGAGAGPWYLDVLVARPPDVPARATSGPVVRTNSPVVAGGTSLRSGPRLAGAVALTFTGGPDPDVTPAILDLLDRLDVRATFFLDGVAVMRHPDLAAAIRRRGHELGTVGYAGDALDRRDPADLRRHLDLGLFALAGATGRSTRLVRLANPTTAAGLDDEERAVLQQLGADERLVLSDRRVAPGGTSATAAIRDAVPPRGQPAIVDVPLRPGSLRATVPAVEFLVAAVRSRGDRVVTAGAFAGLRASSNPPARSGVRIVAATIVRGVVMTRQVRAAIGVLVVLLVAAGAIRAAVGLAVATRRRRRGDDERPMAALGRAPPAVTVLVATHDEASVILGTLRAVRRAVDYARMPVTTIVLDDGSSDGTAEVVERWAGAEVSVVRLPHRGKCATLNAGLELVTTDVVVMIDADTHLDVRALDRLVEAFDEPEVAAVSGRVQVGNDRNLLGWCQRVEYAVANAIERRLFAGFGVMTCVPGALGAYRTSAVRAVGGLPDGTVAEDTDLTLTLQRTGHRVVYAPSAEAWTFAPVTLRAFYRQRVRWSLGVLQNVVKHRGLPLARSGRQPRALRALIPYLVAFGGLSVLGPVVDAVAVVALLTGSFHTSLWLLAAVGATTTALAAVALRYDGQPMRYLAVLPVQVLLYRPLVSVTQLRAIQALLGAVPVKWGAPRLGAEPQPAASSRPLGAAPAPARTPAHAREAIRR